MNNANDLAAAVLANNNDTKTKTATTTTANKSITHNNSNTNKNNVVSTNLRAVKESSSLCNNNSSVASSNLNALEQQHQQQSKTAIESVKTSMKNVGEKQLSNESIKHHHQASDQEETMNHHYTAHHNLNHHHNHYQKQPSQQQSSSSSSSALNGFSGHTNSLNDLKSKFESINTSSSTTTTSNCCSSSQSLRTSSHHYTNSSGGSNHHNNPYFSAWANLGSANNNNNNIRQSANLNSAKLLLSPFSSSTSGIRENIFFNHSSDHKTPNTNVVASNEVSSISSSPTTIKSPSQLIAAATANNSSSSGNNNKAKIMTSSDASNENTTTPLTTNTAQSQQRTNRISNVPCNHHVTNDENEVTAAAQVINNASEQTSNVAQPIVNSSSTSCSINGSFSALTLVGGSTKSNGVATTTVKPTSECSGGNTHVSLRQHSAKCNIMLRKMRRGNKRSKSLPSKFNIDSVLEYLNYSMILNKYELRKQLNQQRNLIFTHHNYNNYNTRLSSSNASTCSTSQQPQQQHLDTANKNKQSCVVVGGGLRKSTYQHQLSSGYNSENHSSSSNSQTTATTTATTTPTTTACRSNAAACHNNDEYMALFNFYRLTLNHLPSNFSANTLCTCSVAATGNNRKSASLKAPCDNECNPVSSSPIISSTAAAASRGGGTTDDDELLVDEDEDFDDEEDDEMLLEDEMMGEEEEEPVAAATTSNNLTNSSCKSPTTTSQQHQQSKTPSKTSNVDPTVFVVTEATPEAAAEFSNVHTSGPSRFHRAPGTSMCPHTAKIDIRRVRSYQDLTQAQILYTLSDFVFKEKLGEGFFANVKKIVSKRTNKEMVLKELKLGCVGDEISAGIGGAETESATSPTTNEPVESSAASSSTHTSTSFNSNRISAKTFNYAELHAAHKSFLKEAQVLRNLNHPNIIKLLGILFTKQKHLNLVLEYIGGGTLKDIIHNISIGLPWKLRVGYARDIAAAMQYLHSLNIIHRDLKSDNCLVRENGRSVVVADFGLSRIINQSSASTTSTAAKKTNNKQSPLFTGDESLLKVANNNHSLQLLSTNLSGLTPVQSGTNSFIVAAKRKLKRRGENHPRKQRYAVVGNSFSMAPEMLKHELYDERVDIFSFGIICCEIIGRVQADPDYLPRTSDFGLNVELFRKKYCEADCPKHFIKIAIACCELEPEKRPPFAKTHVWLETILGHLETNNPIPKNLLKNILESNTKRPSVVVSSSNLITQ